MCFDPPTTKFEKLLEDNINDTHIYDYESCHDAIHYINDVRIYDEYLYDLDPNFCIEALNILNNGLKYGDYFILYNSRYMQNDRNVACDIVNNIIEYLGPGREV